MKFGVLISVANMKKARSFYEDVMKQKVLMDEEMGVHVTYESGLSLQFGYEELVGKKLEMHTKPNNFQLSFEVDDLDHFETKIKSIEGIEILHDIKEYPWGQRVMRFYDQDKHIVELAENMGVVAKRFIKSGMSVTEVAARMGGVPEDYVKGLLS